MADTQAAIEYVLAWQDAVGMITATSDGKRTRYGIKEHWHPELTNCLYFTSMSRAAALQLASGVFAVSYCEPLCIAEIGNQEIANLLLLLAVKVGVVPAGRILQYAVGVVGDGRIGPETLYVLDFLSVRRTWLLTHYLQAALASEVEGKIK